MKKTKLYEEPEEEWKRRSKTYKTTEWANRDKYGEQLLKYMKLKGDEVVLDLGTGTGKVAKIISGHCKIIHGLDISGDMLKNYEVPTVFRKQGDCREIPYKNEVFDVVIARMLFHHLTDFGDIEKTMGEIKRVLKPGGIFVLAEGIPPNEGESKRRFIDIFKLKEERLTFMPNDMMNIITRNGLKLKQIDIFTLNQICINDWLDSCNLPQDTKDKILEMIIDQKYPTYIKEHNQTIKDEKVFMDFMHCIVVGQKR